MSKRLPILALLVLFALAPIGLSACGGSDGDDSPAPVTEAPVTATELTQADLVSTGDGICAEVNAAIGSIQASDISDDATKATQVADLYAGLADSLEGLGSPSDGEPPTDVISAARALGDLTAADETALSTFQTAASDYGMLICAEAPAAPVDSGTDGTVVPTDPGTSEPAPAPAPAPTPAPAPEPVPAPPTGGGVTPVAPDTGGGTGGSGGSSGGSSGGISPG